MLVLHFHRSSARHAEPLATPVTMAAARPAERVRRERSQRRPADADVVWRELTTEVAPAVERFDPATLRDLPDPARRFLGRVLPEGAPLAMATTLSQSGEIRLGKRWMPFTADQLLVAGAGFVWKPVVGSGLMRVTGSDVLTAAGAAMDFRLWGLVPVARGSGPDVTRSAIGRLVAETVAWLPQALTPQAGAVWTPVDHRRAVVRLAALGESVDVEVTVGDDGRLRSLSLDRWSDRLDPPGFEPFGAHVDGELTGPDGVVIAGAGTGGWGWDTPQWPDGAFYRYTVDEAHPLGI
ncbi:MAG: DUF6544 family protein [Actinomycetota bacterium]|nr:DUF6544 family protein [Actinomycetota bacterium]